MTQPIYDSPGRSALVIGASGLVGGHCLDLLLEEPRYEAVHTIGRRPLDRIHPRLSSHVVDFDNLRDAPDLFRVDDIFCCLGTTIRKAGSQEAFKRIDIGYPATAADLAAENGADQFLVVSALGADHESRIFYNRAKGEMEESVRRAELGAIWIFRPSLLLGDREELRIGERVAEIMMRPVTPLLIGPARRYRPIRAKDVAVAMVRLALSSGTGGTLESDEIQEVADS